MPELIIVVVVLAFAVISARTAKGPLSPAIFFAVIGLALGARGLGVIRVAPEGHAVTALVEGTLALILFTDAVRIDLRALRKELSVPVRLLGIGLPLTIVAGALVGKVLFPGSAWAEVLLIGAVLAPTDAALGQAVVSNARIPMRVRQGLNVESGLNDGMAVPFVLVLIEVLRVESGEAGWGSFVTTMAEQIGLGLVAGVVAGVVAGLAIRWASDRGWIEPGWRRLAVLAGPLGAFSLAVFVGGSGFIAAYTAGIAFGLVNRDRSHELTAFADEAGELLAALTWVVFGAALLPLAFDVLSWEVVLYALLSLTIVRMLPVAVSMLGTGARRPTLAFMGWFGPRGLASVAFALLILEAEIPGGHEIVAVAFVTVALSVLLHGVTANWGAGRYASWYETHPRRTDLMESVPTPELRTRGPKRGRAES